MKPTVKMWSELVNNEIIMTIKMPSIDHPNDPVDPHVSD